MDGSRQSFVLISGWKRRGGLSLSVCARGDARADPAAEAGAKGRAWPYFIAPAIRKDAAVVIRGQIRHRQLPRLMVTIGRD